MQESVLRSINLHNRKWRNQQNEATTNHERSAIPHPMGAHPKDAVSWCRIGGTFVIDRGFIQLIPFRCFAMSHEAEFTECADPIRSTKIAFVNGSHELRIRSMEHRKLNSCVSKIIHKYRDIALSSF